jgi:hypothetical protein
VRVKSRFALYSASGTLAARRFAGAFAADLADVFFVADLGAPLADGLELSDLRGLALVVPPRLEPRFAAFFARVAPVRGLDRFAPERAPARFVAIPPFLPRTCPQRPLEPVTATGERARRARPNAQGTASCWQA